MTTFTEALDGDGPPGGDPSSLRPRALIVTIYGLYAREYDGWLSVAALIRLMAGLGVDEPAVRSSISRLKRRGVLDPRRQAGAAGYALSASGRRMLAEGDRRLFGRAGEAAGAGAAGGASAVAGAGAVAGERAGEWVLAVFSVPEPERRQRHALRSRLAWLGFGTVSAGVWIAPGHLASETREVLAADGLAGYVALFQAGYLAFGDIASQVGQWWDLDRLQQMYQEFHQAHAPRLGAWGEAGSPAAGPPAARDPAGEPRAAGISTGGAAATGDAAAFAAYVRVFTDWRRLPFLDPGLPADLLPVPWHGHAAAGLFAALAARLAPAAERHVRAVVAG